MFARDFRVFSVFRGQSSPLVDGPDRYMITNDGIRFAGLALVGEKNVEVNVFSPSGHQDFGDEPSAQRIVTSLLSRG